MIHERPRPSQPHARAQACTASEMHNKDEEMNRAFAEWSDLTNVRFVGNSLENNRARKRHKTQQVYVRHEEDSLEDLREGYVKVMSAFESAMEMLNRGWKLVPFLLIDLFFSWNHNAIFGNRSDPMQLRLCPLHLRPKSDSSDGKVDPIHLSRRSLKAIRPRGPHRDQFNWLVFTSLDDQARSPLKTHRKTSIYYKELIEETNSSQQREQAHRGSEAMAWDEAGRIEEVIESSFRRLGQEDTTFEDVGARQNLDFHSCRPLNLVTFSCVSSRGGFYAYFCLWTFTRPDDIPVDGGFFSSNKHFNSSAYAIARCIGLRCYLYRTFSSSNASCPPLATISSPNYTTSFSNLNFVGF
ncbi:hypothetical protein KVT40_009249 [Elsinoe batatas]|uniref:Uncharacterized protein n=1 Tax=Elsinoe batatas TaxID=2601811 RepID=A0A8K0KSY6_9PEZI|nr:hypothetical protein KVT40_009249 [Elsinoe batatas]